MILMWRLAIMFLEMKTFLWIWWQFCNKSCEHTMCILHCISMCMKSCKGTMHLITPSSSVFFQLMKLGSFYQVTLLLKETITTLSYISTQNIITTLQTIMTIYSCNALLKAMLHMILHIMFFLRAWLIFRITNAHIFETDYSLAVYGLSHSDPSKKVLHHTLRMLSVSNIFGWHVCVHQSGVPSFHMNSTTVALCDYVEWYWGCSIYDWWQHWPFSIGRTHHTAFFLPWRTMRDASMLPRWNGYRLPLQKNWHLPDNDSQPKLAWNYTRTVAWSNSSWLAWSCVLCVSFEDESLGHCNFEGWHLWSLCCPYLLNWIPKMRPPTYASFDFFEAQIQAPCSRNSQLHHLCRMAWSQYHPHLFEAVKKFMVHGPCGALNPNLPCTRDGKCMYRYPKPFQECMTMNQDRYPQYSHRNDGCMYNIRGFWLDNYWIIPYNPFCMIWLSCHINVECAVCFGSMKYINKYIDKGGDCGILSIWHNTQNKVKQYIDGCYFCASEAMWQILQFRLHEQHPNVIWLQMHLPHEQHIVFDPSHNACQIIEYAENADTTLTAFF